MFATFIVIGGTSFGISYVLTIRRGFLDHTYGVPLVALCAFMVWDVRNALGVYHPWISALGAISGLYVVGHAIVFYQLLRYGPREFSWLSGRAFYGMVAAVMGMATFAVPAVDQSLHDTWGVHTAQGSWLVAMACYPMLLWGRGSTRGQSIPICLFQFVTGIAASIACLGCLPEASGVRGSHLLRFIGLGIVAANLMYLWALLRMRQVGHGRISGQERG